MIVKSASFRDRSADYLGLPPTAVDQPLFRHLTSIIHGCDIDAGSDEQLAANLLFNGGAGPLGAMRRRGREKTHSARGMIRTSLYSDTCIKSFYETHIIGKGATCVGLQSKATINQVFRRTLSEVEGFHYTLGFVLATSLATRVVPSCIKLE